jgi:hypothetical protein
MLRKIVAAVNNVVAKWSRSIKTAVKRLLDPARDRANILAGAAHDAVRPRSELVAENALLRQQLIVLRRKNKRPALSDGDRIVMVLLARLDRAWRDALHLVKPDTRAALASLAPGSVQAHLEAKVAIRPESAQAAQQGQHRANHGNGERQRALGR